MIDLIAIDPGGAKKRCSSAFFDRGALVGVRERIAAADAFGTAVAVVERPQQDQRSRAVPPRILIDLAWQGALVVGAFAALGARVVEYTPAQWKAGELADGRYLSSIHKAAHHANMIESGAITAEELNTVWGGHPIHREVFEARRKAALKRWSVPGYSASSRTPDVLDAVGLGLYHLGRIDKDGKRK